MACCLYNNVNRRGGKEEERETGMEGGRGQGAMGVWGGCRGGQKMEKEGMKTKKRGDKRTGGTL